MDLQEELAPVMSRELSTEMGFQDEESLVEDHRATTPVRVVEQKLFAAMGLSPINISQLQTFTRPGAR
jgi:hypothetical protein